MAGRLIEIPCDDFMTAAERELIAFERQKRELRRQEKLERAEQLKMPALNELHS